MLQLTIRYAKKKFIVKTPRVSLVLTLQHVHAGQLHSVIHVF